RDGPAHPRPGHRRGELPRRRARPARLRHRVDRHGRRPGVSPAPALPLPLLHSRRRPLRPAMPHQPGPAAADRRGGGGGAIEDPQRQRQPAARACPHGEQMSQYKIWFQGATDRVEHAPYISRVEPHLKAILDPGFTGTFNTTTPPATTTHAVTEFRIARNFIRNALEAERQGYDAVAITHFQDAGAAVIVPAGGLPMMLYAAQPGANMEGAPIVNGITLIAKAAEMAIKLRKLSGTGVSRRSNFAKPPEKSLKEFLEHG